MLTGQVAERTRDILRQICMEHEIHIVSGKVAADRVHMFVSYRPQMAAAAPFAWVAADSVYGVGAVEGALRRAGKGYVLGIASNHSVTSWGKAKPIAGTAESVAQSLAASDWRRLSAGDGAKGPRLYDWAYVELADLDASEYDPAAQAFGPAAF